MKTHFLQVKEVVKETIDSVTLSFWHPLSEQIKYKAGQFVSLIVPADNGNKVRRSYSMSSSPYTESSLAVTVKRVKGGLVSNYLCDRVAKGDFIEIVEPMGHFFVVPDKDKERHLVFIGAGSGITPLLSMIKSILKMEPKSKVSLIYGNRSLENIIFRKTLLTLEATYREQFQMANVLSQAEGSWGGHKGRINKANVVTMLKDFGIQFKEEEFFLCGPSEMMDEVIDALKMFEVAGKRIHKENFHAPMLEEAIETDKEEGLVVREVSINYDGDTNTFLVKPHESILEAALERDIDLPYSCQAGMCTACMGKCSSGNVKMDEVDGLTDSEIKQGFVLTCVSHPLTDDVVIDVL